MAVLSQHQGTEQGSCEGPGADTTTETGVEKGGSGQVWSSEQEAGGLQKTMDKPELWTQ